MTEECLLCETQQEIVSAGLCSYCLTDTCINCSVSDVSFVDSRFKCSHGCEYDVQEYMLNKIYTTILNGGWKEKLAIAGKYIEYIISNPDKITVHKTIPTDIPSESVLGTHYTPNPKELYTYGFDRSLQRENNQKYYSDTVRGTAAYAWPYNPGFTEEYFEWQSDFVFFEVPKDSVYVSSYRYLDWIKDGGEYSIPVEKYDESLTFTPEQLYTVSEQIGRPTRISNLLEL